MAKDVIGKVELDLVKSRFIIGIPGARFVPLESRIHVTVPGEPAWQRLVPEVEGFLAQEDLR